MAAKRGGKTQKRGGAKSGLLLVGIGLVVGLGLAAAYLVYGDREQLDAILPQPNAEAQAPAPSREREPVAQEPEAVAADEPARPTFDFYTVLPEKEVELPGEPAEGAPTTATPASAANAVQPGAASAAAASAATPPTAASSTSPPIASAAPSPSAGLKLQAGAFSTAADAEALRAKLALVGQTARIETVQANGRTLHRVRLGPYADVAAREAAQKALAEAGVTATPAR